MYIKNIHNLFIIDRKEIFHNNKIIRKDGITQ